MLDFFRKVFDKKPYFYPYEIAIFNEVKSHLSEKAQILFQKQLDAINKIQRFTNNKEVNLYRMRFGKPTFDDSIRFPNSIKEAVFAKVCCVGESNKAIIVKIWLVQGYIFSLTFNKPPKILCINSTLKTILPTITSVEILTDLMSVNKQHSKTEIDIPALWIKDIINKAYEPLSAIEIQSALKYIDAKLPDDYIDLIYKVDGASGKNFLVYGINDIREIGFDDCNYYILAEFEGLGVMAVKSENNDGELYLLRYENENIKCLGKSFECALKDVLRL